MISRILSLRKEGKYALLYFVGDRERQSLVTPEDRQQMIDLCHRIARETDPKKLTRWIEELNGLIQIKVRELRDTQKGC